MIDEPGNAGTSDLAKEMTMLKTISAALIATSLIAAPALAANSGSAGTATPTQPTADKATPAPKAPKVTSTKSKKQHTSFKTAHHHNKKIGLHKTHARTSAKVASKASAKPVVPATKRS
jgi:hypothetical protein